MNAYARTVVSMLAGIAVVAGFLVSPAQAEDAETPEPVRASIVSYWQARSNFARSNFARSNFARSNFAALGEQTGNVFGLDDSVVDAAVHGAIDGEDYRCGPTDFDSYVDQLLAGLTDDELAFLLDSGVLEFPTMEAIFFGSGADSGFADRSQGKALSKTVRKLEKFWPTAGSDVDLVALHGDMLRDPQRISRVLVALYGFTQADADAYADSVVRVITDVPAFAGGDNALFSLNAFSFTVHDDPDPLIAGLGPKIVVGDGFLHALSAMGIDDVGIPVVLAHEYAHQQQAEHDQFDAPFSGPAATRRVELMADAYASYFAVHARGLSLNAKRVVDVQQTFYELGDCAFADPGHHGTPAQGLRASTWATELAADAQPQGHIVSVQELGALFDAELPAIVEPDN